MSFCAVGSGRFIPISERLAGESLEGTNRCLTGFCLPGDDQNTSR